MGPNCEGLGRVAQKEAYVNCVAHEYILRTKYMNRSPHQRKFSICYGRITKQKVFETYNPFFLVSRIISNNFVVKLAHSGWKLAHPLQKRSYHVKM